MVAAKFGDGVGEEPFDADEGFVAGGQDGVGDEEMPQVVGGLPSWVGVERLMAAGECAGSEVGQQFAPAPLRSQFNALRGVPVAMIDS